MVNMLVEKSRKNSGLSSLKRVVARTANAIVVMMRRAIALETGCKEDPNAATMRFSERNLLKRRMTRKTRIGLSMRSASSFTRNETTDSTLTKISSTFQGLEAHFMKTRSQKCARSCKSPPS